MVSTKIPATELQLIREYLKRASAEKQRLVNWYKNALERVHHDRTGQKTGRTALVVLVQALNRCLIHYTGRPISTGARKLNGVCREASAQLHFLVFWTLIEKRRLSERSRMTVQSKELER